MEQLVSRSGFRGGLTDSIPAAHSAEWEGVNDPRGISHLQPLAVFWLYRDLPQVSGFPAQVLQSPELLLMVNVFYLLP